MPGGDSDGVWFRDQIGSIFGYGAQLKLAYLLAKLGDKRKLRTILSQINRIARGKTVLSTPMRCFVVLLTHTIGADGPTEWIKSAIVPAMEAAGINDRQVQRRTFESLTAAAEFVAEVFDLVTSGSRDAPSCGLNRGAPTRKQAPPIAPPLTSPGGLAVRQVMQSGPPARLLGLS